jgi:hypothetical protein
MHGGSLKFRNDISLAVKCAIVNMETTAILTRILPEIIMPFG